MYIAKFENLNELIIEIRNEKVLLDADVAVIYGVETKRINEAVKKYRESEAERSRVSLKDDPSNKDAVAEEDLPESESGEPKLEDDPQMQEGLRIAADYVQLLKNQKTGPVEIVGLQKKSATVADTTNKDKKPAVADAPVAPAKSEAKGRAPATP
mgnify:CR=1 FL=1